MVHLSRSLIIKYVGLELNFPFMLSFDNWDILESFSCTDNIIMVFVNEKATGIEVCVCV